MARYKNGINGPFSGKVGTVVGASWRGIDYVRSVQKAITKPASQAQINQRLVFALVTGWLKPLRDLIWIGFQIFKGTKTPMNGCVSFVMKEAVTGDGEQSNINFPKVVFSRGELFISLIREFTAIADALLHIKWENGSASAFNSADDKATFIVYNPVKEKFVSFEGVARRADLEKTLQLPANFKNDIVHCWMHYVNAAGDAVSTSFYLGNIAIF